MAVLTGPLIYPAYDLPENPLDAAAIFLARMVPDIRAGLGDHDEVRVLFGDADYSHESWRRSAIAELAREAAPKRVNAIVGNDDDQLAQVGVYLGKAPGVTGQVLQMATPSGPKA